MQCAEGRHEICVSVPWQLSVAVGKVDTRRRLNFRTAFCHRAGEAPRYYFYPVVAER